MTIASDWRPVPSAPGYFARADGRIRGLRGSIMQPNTSGPYPRITVMLPDREANICVHVLVCEAFHGPRPSSLHEVAHRDGHGENSSADNLRWATPKENTEDKKLHGTWPSGEMNGRALLSEADVAIIRSVYAASMGKKYVKRGTREALAARFGVNVGVIKDIIYGRSWRHVAIDLPFMAPPEGSAHA